MDAGRLIKDYRTYLTIERGMSPNTVASYAHDVAPLLEENAGGKLQDITSATITAFLGERREGGLSKRSQARLVSALRSFFAWCVEEGDLRENPCDALETPKIGTYLPSVLSVEEVTAILESVDTSTATGKRDRAILEVLYGCGLRVSELTDLRLSRINFREGFVDVVGKATSSAWFPWERWPPMPLPPTCPSGPNPPPAKTKTSSSWAGAAAGSAASGSSTW